MKILIFFLLLHATNVYGSVYYVKNTGNDEASGLSDAEAWRTIKKVNQYQFVSGDIVCFKRGSVFRDATVTSPDVNDFTFQDYGTGPKPLLDGDAIQPISIKPESTINNLTIINIDIGGQDWSFGKESNLYVSNVHGLTIDGIVGNGHKDGNTSLGKTAITINHCSGSVIVKNCELFNFGPTTLLNGNIDFMGIAIINQIYGNYTIQNNKIFNVGSDAIHIYKCTAFGSLESNTIYNSGENCIDIKGSSNLQIENNNFFRTNNFIGSGGTGVGDYPTLVDIHEGGKNITSSNIKVINNYFHDGDAAGIRIARAEDIYIEDNVFENISTSIVIGNPSNNVVVLGNLFLNPNKRLSISSKKDASCIIENNSGFGTKIHYNTFLNDVGTGIILLLIESNKNTSIFRNVFKQNNQVLDSFCFFKISDMGVVRFDENCWFNKSDPSRSVYYDSRVYGRGTESIWNFFAPNDIFVDPLLVDLLKGDYSLQSTTPCQTDGVMWGANATAIRNVFLSNNLQR